MIDLGEFPLAPSGTFADVAIENLFNEIADKLSASPRLAKAVTELTSRELDNSSKASFDAALERTTAALMFAAIQEDRLPIIVINSKTGDLHLPFKRFFCPESRTTCPELKNCRYPDVPVYSLAHGVLHPSDACLEDLKRDRDSFAESRLALMTTAQGRQALLQDLFPWRGVQIEGEESDLKPLTQSSIENAASARRRSSPMKARAESILDELWPLGIPTQPQVTNVELHKIVANLCKTRGLAEPSNDTVLRAAKRR